MSVIALPQFGPPETDAEIINAAGIICGNYNILINETGNRFAQAASALYGGLVAAELGSNRWRFALADTQISIFTGLQPLEQFDSWIYEAALPGDMLVLLSTFPFIRYTIWGDKLLTTGNSPLILKYLRYVPVNKWNVAFRYFMCYQLAEHLSLSVCTDVKNRAIQEMRKHWESRALFSDGQSVPGRPFIHKPWWDIRFEGGT